MTQTNKIQTTTAVSRKIYSATFLENSLHST